MREMTPAELDAYLASDKWVGCSGAYSIDEENDPFMKVTGSITNVIGLPIESVRQCLDMLARLPPYSSESITSESNVP